MTLGDLSEHLECPQHTDVIEEGGTDRPITSQRSLRYKGPAAAELTELVSGFVLRVCDGVGCRVMLLDSRGHTAGHNDGCKKRAGVTGGKHGLRNHGV
jgi:hypothetical protein